MAVTVLAMIVSGLVLSVPALAQVADRPTAKAWHLWSAWALAIGTVILLVVHHRRLVATVRDLERFTRDDVRWLRQVPRRILDRVGPPPQGRFNAGQKMNTAITLGLIVVTYITGILLWLGERNNDLRYSGTITVHDTAMWLIVFLVIGHIYMAAFNPHTSPALRGIITGSVSRAWARRHHPDWVRDVEAQEAAGPTDHPHRRRAPRRSRRTPPG